MIQLRIRLLGEFEARAGVEQVKLRLPKKTIGLLAYLAVRLGQECSRSKLAGLLWGDRGPDQARHSLRQALLTLRRPLAEHSPRLIVPEDETLSLAADGVEVDVHVFERLAAEGSRGSLEKAASVCRGEFLEGLHIDELPFQEWVAGERERLRELALEALARLLQYQRRSSPVDTAIQTALRLLRIDRTQEVVHRALIQLYAQQGRRAEAVRQYRTCVGVLREELGLEPEPETVRLYREILTPRVVARLAPHH